MNRADLKNDLLSTFATGKSGGITAADLRSLTTKLIDSFFDPLDDGSAVTAYNVKSYGAMGNGSTNDTNAITACINAAPPGSAIFFPPGIYFTNAPVYITKSLTVWGYGATIKSSVYTQGVKLAITSSGVIIRGLTIDGGYTSGLTTYAGGSLISATVTVAPTATEVSG